MKRKALIVEDEVALALGFQAMLQRAGYEVFHAENGKEGWESLKRFKPDLLITNLVMPVMTGMELIKKARSHSQFKKIPILVITASPETLLKENLRGIEVLEKPASFERMVEAVEEVFERRKGEREKVQDPL